MKLAQYKYNPEYKDKWNSGGIFTVSNFNNNSNSIFPAYRLRIQTLPGVEFNINNSLDWVEVGYDGVYELDLGSQPLITSLRFSSNSLNNITNTNSELLVEIFYEGKYN